MWLASCLLLRYCPRHAEAKEPAHYRFQEGEPLSYKLELTVTNQSVIESQLITGSDRSQRESALTFGINYQLMPIAQSEDGSWKLRVALDQIEQTVNHDGEIKRKKFDRADLRRHQISASEILKLNLLDSVLRRQTSEEVTSTAPGQAVPAPVHDAEDLFEQPILAWLAQDGTLKDFEDRSELQQVMPGINLRECIKLVIPPLPVPEIKAGVTWMREIPVDLPAEPLSGEKPEAMNLQLIYTVQKMEKIAGESCARIAVQGHFVSKSLSIPIRREEIKYLIWTVSISKIEDHIEGEFVYSLDQKLVRSSDLTSIYSYSTSAGRKTDNYRGKILSDNVVRTRLSGRLVETPLDKTQTPLPSTGLEAGGRTNSSLSKISK
ncbi:MAG: hypothetical protein HY043_20560 [Verrucomicrobia bacterium]|nr:hypothetical protein [Verrucomicrobiota bacterium]